MNSKLLNSAKNDLVSHPAQRGGVGLIHIIILIILEPIQLCANYLD